MDKFTIGVSLVVWFFTFVCFGAGVGCFWYFLSKIARKIRKKKGGEKSENEK